LTKQLNGKVEFQILRFKAAFTDCMKNDTRVVAQIPEDWLLSLIKQWATPLWYAETADVLDHPLAKHNLKSLDDKTSWLGYQTSAVWSGVEQFLLPTLFVNLGCSIKVICAPLTELLEAAEAWCATANRKLSNDAVKDYLAQQSAWPK
jgi:hypothetical protein